jgi:hypothetical protein
MRKTRRLAAVLLLVLGAAGFTAACSSGSKSSAPKSAPKKDSGAGARVMECVVVERGQGAPSRTSSYSSGETYYLVFETKEGEATARYQYEVTRQQWFRYPEGSRVRVTLNNNILQNIQPSTEK